MSLAKLPPLGSYGLRVAGYFSEFVPTSDPIFSAAMAVVNFKRKYPDMWEAFEEVGLAPEAVADTMFRVMLDEERKIG